LGKLNWMDVSDLSFNALLLLEKMQLDYLDKLDFPEKDFVIALDNNPAVEWYIRNQVERLGNWLDELKMNNQYENVDKKRIREAEIEVMENMNDWLVYVVDPEEYDNQSFLEWDSDELRDIVDFENKTVIDLGAGTGRLTFVAAEKAKSVFAVEPIANLRDYIKNKASELEYDNIYTTDGLMEEIPFPDDFAEVITGGHVFGDYFDREYNELIRVIKDGGKIILCPGNNDVDNDRHKYLVDKGFNWSSFMEPGDGMKRKYWKRVKK